MTSVLAKSNRGKGYSSAQAREVVSNLAPEIKEALGEGGLDALKDLADEAPGTFFHALAVNQLMKIKYPQPKYQAAVLLHDIGKLSRPSIFAENLIGDSTRPEPSDIRAHVEYGKVLARHYGLSDLCYQAINEHHGTLPIWHPTLQEESYLGQSPQSQFTATLMMADTIEAMHASKRLTRPAILEILKDRSEQWAAIDEKKLSKDSVELAVTIIRNPQIVDFTVADVKAPSISQETHARPQLDTQLEL